MLAVTGTGAVLAPAGAGPDWFDVGELGARGYKYLPPAARYLLAATRRAVADGGELAYALPERRGAAVATNGGVAALLAELDDLIVKGHAAELSPALAPFFAVNVLTSRLAAEQELRGFTLSLTSPGIAALEAIETGGRALGAGRCDVLLVAATEERPPGTVAGESGAVAFVLEDADSAAARGARVHGTCDARTAFAPPGLLATDDGRHRLRNLVDGIIARLEATPTVVHAVLDDSTVSTEVRRLLPDLADRIEIEPTGSGCLTPPRRLAALLSGDEGESLLVVATGRGHLAFARTIPTRRQQ